MTDPMLRVVPDHWPQIHYECSGGCGRYSPPSPYRTVSAMCETCYLRDYGEPAAGFVGFLNGWLYVLDYGEGKTRLQDANDSRDMLGVLIVVAMIEIAFGIAIALWLW